jgi:hypothetical protein
VTALWVCVHPISKETAVELLDSGVVSHREATIQTCELYSCYDKGALKLVKC